MEFDDVLRQHVGEFGRYQKRVCFLLTLVAISNAFYVMDIVFMTAIPEHWCLASPNQVSISAVDSNASSSFSGHPNLTSEDIVALTIPSENIEGRRVSSHCEIYDNAWEHLEEAQLAGNVSSTIERLRASKNASSSYCSQWEYGDAQFANGVVKQWDLVCHRRWLIATVNSAFLAGTLVGVMSGGVLSDRFGRRPVLAAFAAMAIGFRLIMVFSPNVYFFIVLRFFIGLTNLDTYTSAFVLGTELVGPKWRVLMGNGMCVVWAFGYMTLAGIAYCLKDTSWQTLTLTLTGCCLYVFLYFCAVPESPRWLLARGRKDEALAILRKMAKVNGRDLPDGIEFEVSEAGKNHIANPFILLRTAALRRRAIIILYTWFCAACVYYGLSLNVGDLAGNVYLNTFIMGAVELPAYFLTQVLMSRRPGRRGTMSSFLVWSGLVLLATAFVPDHLKTVRTALAMIGKLTISGGFAAAYVFTVELFPTGLRQVTLGICSTTGRMGGVIAPYIGQLARYDPLIPICILGVLALTAGVTSLFLPETRGRPLPLTVDDVENMKGNCSWNVSEVPTEDSGEDDVVSSKSLMKKELPV